MDAVYRWIAVVSVVGVMGISSYFRARARSASGVIPRRREPPALIAGRLALGLPLFGSTLVYLVSPAAMAWASWPLPPPARTAGAALGLLAIPGAYWVFSSIGENVSETVLTKDRHTLVTHGPYQWIRHPLYALGLGVFTGVGLMAANWFILACAAAAGIAIRVGVIPREEAALVARFGDDYRRYRASTGCLLPRVGR